MPRELRKLKGAVDRGLGQTAEMWPQVRTGFGPVHRAARELGGERELAGKGVRRRYERMLEDARAAAEHAAPGSKLRNAEGPGALPKGDPEP